MFWVSWLPLLWSPKLQGSVTSCPCPKGWQYFGNTPETLGSQGFSLQPPDPRSLCLTSGAQHPLLAAPAELCPHPPQHTTCFLQGLGEPSHLSSGLCSRYGLLFPKSQELGCSRALAKQWEIPPHSGISLPRPDPGFAITPGSLLILSGGLGGPNTKLKTKSLVESPGFSK